MFLLGLAATSLNNIVAGDVNVICGASNGTFNLAQVVGATTVSATATLGGSTASDYTFGAAGTAVNTTTPQITASANITTLVLTPTLNAATKVFDGTTTEMNPMTCSVATVISPDVVTCAATNGTFNTSQVSTANSVTATVTISGAAVSNYTLGAGLTTVSVPSVSVSGSSSISQAPSTTTVTCPPGPYFYTGLPQAPCSVTVTGAGSLSLTPTPSYGNNTYASPSPATASYTFASDGNHTGSNGSANFTISPAPLTIVASSGSLTYGSPVPPITAGFSGFVPNENASVLTTPPSCVTAYTPISPSSAPPYPTYPTTCLGAAAANYTIGYMPGSITVSQAPLQITASSATITAGAPVPTITAGYSGFVNTESSASLTTQPTCSTTYTVGSPASPPPYPTTCSGAVDNNYNISYVAGAVTVNAPTTPLQITAGPVTGFQNYTYPATLLVATGGTPPYTWSGAAIAGMNLTAGGVLTGYPTAAGTANVTVTDSNSVSVSAPFTIYSPTVVRGGAGDTQTISSVTLNTALNQQLTAAPGTPITVGFTYNIVQAGACPHCIDQLLVGFVNTTPGTCVYDGIPGVPVSGTGDQTGTVNLTAPSTPGRYYIAFYVTENDFCQPVDPSFGSAYTLASTDPAIAVVDVIPTASVIWENITATNISVTPQVNTGDQVTATFTWNNGPSNIGTIGLGFNTDPGLDQCGVLNYGTVSPTLTAPSQPGRYYLSIDNPNPCSGTPPTPWSAGIPGANFAQYIGAVDVLPQP